MVFRKLFHSKKFTRLGFMLFIVLLLLVPTILVILATPKKSEAAWYSSAWGYRKKLTINNAQVSGSGDLTDFPIFVSLVDSELASRAQSDGDDILFTTANGTTKIDHEIEKYTSSTGTLLAWVEIPTLGGATDTIIYMYYGNSIASNQQNTTGTWNSGYAGVWHFSETSGQHLDSTSNNNDSTTVSVVTQGSATGKVDGADEYNNAGNAIGIPGSASLQLTSEFTLEAWVNPDTIPSGSNWDAVIYSDDSNPNYYIELTDSNEIEVGMHNSSAYIGAFSTTSPVSTGAYNYITTTFVNATDTIKGYVNGTEVASNTSATGTPNTTGNLAFGANIFTEYFDGVIDEVRISNTARSTDWMTTTYNTINSPSTFFTTGSQELQSNATNTMSDPIVYWGMDEGTGTTIKDRTANQNSGTITNAIWKSEDLCVIGKCLYFDGTGDYVSRASDADFSYSYNDSFSITGWFRHEPMTSGTDMIVARHNGAVDGGFKLYMESDGDITCGLDRDSTFSPEDSVTSTAATYDDNQWHHIACIKSSNTSLTLYIDGISVGTPDSSLQSSGTYANTDTFYLGIDGDGSSNGFEGFLDEFKIYNGAISASQLKADMIASGTLRGGAAQFGQASTTFLNDGLVGYWKLDEASGLTRNCTATPFTDSSGNGNNGESCPSTTGPDGGGIGKFGNGVSFDGTDDYISTTANGMPAIDGNMTFSLWYYGTTAPSTDDSNLVSITDNSSSATSFELRSTGFLQARTWAGATNLVSTTAPSLNTWHHLVYSFDGKTNKIYIDGILQATDTSVPHNSGTPSEVEIGNRYTSGAVARLDDIRIYNRTLSDAEVKQLYNWAPGPYSYLSFNENTGTTANDIMGNAIHGTLRHQAKFGLGKYGAGMYFNGVANGTLATDTSVSLDNNAYNSLTEGTISMWVKPSLSGDTFQNIFSAGDTGDSEYYEVGFDITTNAFAVATSGCASSGFSMETPAISNPSGWHHISFQVGNAGNSFYVDGVRQPMTYSTGTSASTCFFSNWATGSNRTYRLGCIAFIATDCYEDEMYNGAIDEFRIYNYPRTASQILEDMNGGHPVGGSPIGSQIIYSKLDEQSGSTLQNSVSTQTSLTGTLTGTAWLTDTTCKANGCLNFDTTSDSVTYGDVSFTDSLSGFTTSFWINPQSLTTDDSIISKADLTNTNSPLMIRTDSSASDELRIYIGDNADITDYFVSSDFNLTTSSWQHVTVVYDGTQTAANRVKVYKNGRIVTGSVTGTIPTSLDAANTAALRLGDSDVAGSDSLLMYLDEFKFYNAPLSQDSVLIDFNQGSAVNFGVGAPTPEPAQGSDGAGSPPIGYWNFDENTGITAYDKSGNGNTATLFSGAKYAPGKIGSGVYMTNTASYVITDSQFSLNETGPFTISFWVYPKTLAENSTFIAPTSGSFAIYYGSSDEIRMCNDNACSNEAVSNSNPLQLNKWNHLTFTYSGTPSTNNQAYFYVNGINVTSDSSLAEESLATRFRIGNYHTENVPVDGIMDEVKVFSYVRSAAQIAYDYNRGGPVGWWKLDECQGSTSYDSSGNAKTGTINPASSGNTAVGTCTSGTGTHMWYNGATGKLNSALDLDGTDDYISIPSPILPTTDFSYTAWVNLDAINDERIIMIADGSGNNEFDFDVGAAGASPGKVCVEVNGAGCDVLTTNNVSASTWTHIAVTRSGSTITVYINGNPDPTTGTDGSTLSFSTCDLLIGTDADATCTGTLGNYLDGRIDDVRIYSYAISQTQLTKIINDGSSVRFGPQTGSP